MRDFALVINPSDPVGGGAARMNHGFKLGALVLSEQT
jgi:hypothetical protein